MTVTTSIPADLRVLGTTGVLDLVATLPSWDCGLDDDPHWVHPVSHVGLAAHAIPMTGLDTTLLHHRPASDVPLPRVTGANQPLLRLDAVAHYLRTPHVLFDPEGWYDQDLPLLIGRADGDYLVIDGTNRTAAALIRGDATLRCYVIDHTELGPDGPRL